MATKAPKDELNVQKQDKEEKKENDSNTIYNSEHNNLKNNNINSHYVFFYGSCSPISILKDTGVTAIESYPAISRGYVRYFARFSNGRDGGTASLRRATEFDKPYNSVSGWVAKIGDNDLYSMDHREGHPYIYKREYISVNLYLNIGNKTHIIKLDNVWTYFVINNLMEWICPPSHSYLNLCCQTIQHFWEYNNQIVVRNNKYPLYEINEKGKASNLLIFDYFPNLNRTVLKHSTKFGVLASQSTQCKHWKAKRECIRCKSKTWVCFVHNIALFICDPCKQYFNVKEK